MGGRPDDGDRHGGRDVAERARARRDRRGARPRSTALATPSPCPEVIEPLNAARRFADSAFVAGACRTGADVACSELPNGADARSRAQPLPTRQEIAEGLTCQCGCGLTVANCNHPNCSFSVPMRRAYRRDDRRGMGRAQIIAYYPQAVRREDSLRADHRRASTCSRGRCRSSALLVGGGLVVLMMGRWRGGPPSTRRIATRFRLGRFDNSGKSDNSIPRCASDWNANCGSASSRVLSRRRADRRGRRAVRRRAARRRPARDAGAPAATRPRPSGSSMSARSRCRGCASWSSIARWASSPTPTTQSLHEGADDARARRERRARAPARSRTPRRRRCRRVRAGGGRAPRPRLVRSGSGGGAAPPAAAPPPGRASASARNAASRSRRAISAANAVRRFPYRRAPRRGPSDDGARLSRLARSARLSVRPRSCAT